MWNKLVKFAIPTFSVAELHVKLLFADLTAKSNILNLHPLEFGSRYRDPQLQMGKKKILIWDKRCKS